MCGSGFALRRHGSEPPVRQGAMRSLHWIDGDVVQPDHTKDHGYAEQNGAQRHQAKLLGDTRKEQHRGQNHHNDGSINPCFPATVGH
jgi:hypothetical protein